MTENADIISSYGSFYFFFAGIVTFVLLLIELVKEKELKLRKSLIIIGLKVLPYWGSWFITGLIFACIVPFILIGLGYVFSFKFHTSNKF